MGTGPLTGYHLIIGKQGPLQAPSRFKMGRNKGPRNGICKEFGAMFAYRRVCFHVTETV